jgi:hypothetical protein
VTEAIKYFFYKEVWEIGDLSHVSLSGTRYFSKDCGVFACKGQAVDSLRCQEQLTVQHRYIPEDSNSQCCCCENLASDMWVVSYPMSIPIKRLFSPQNQQHYAIILSLIPTNYMLVTNVVSFYSIFSYLFVFIW